MKVSKVNYEELVKFFAWDHDQCGWPLVQQLSLDNFLEKFESQIAWDDDVSEAEKRQMVVDDKDFSELYYKYLLTQLYEVIMNAAAGNKRKKKSIQIK